MRMRGAVSWLIAGLALSCGPKAPPQTAASPGGAPPAEPFLGDLEVYTYTLDNGLTLKVVPDPTAPVVAYQTWFGVGSAEEVEGHTGLAHLFEHLMFKGTDGYADGEYWSRLDALGADGLNAWTWVDQTVYTQSVPSQFAGEVARLEATRLDGLVLDADTFQSERGVVINERKLRVDNDPEGKLDELLMAGAFTTHPYGWPTIGWLADLEAMTLEDARAFYEQWYAPDNATVILVGDITPEGALALVEAQYGHLEPSGVQPVDRPVEPEQTEQRRVETTFPASADIVTVAFKLPPFVSDGMPAVLALDAALTSGRTGRLQRALVDGGFASEVTGFVAPLRDPTVYTVTVKARPGVPAEAVEQALWAELARVRDAGVSAGELAMGISQWQLFTWSNMQDVSGRADFLGWTLTHTGNHLDGVAQLHAINSVTADDVKAAAAATLVPERSTVAVLRADAPADLVEVEAAEPVVPVDEVDVGGRSPVSPPDLPVGEVVRDDAHGAVLLQAFDPTIPVVSFELFFPTGSAADPKGKPGLANLTGQMLLRGTDSWDRGTFEAALEQLGATTDVSVDADGITLHGTVLSRNWRSMIRLLEEAITKPAFDAAELDQLRKEVHNQLAGVRDDDQALATRAADRFAWGADHPYGRDPMGTAAGIDAVTVDDLAGFRDTALRSGGAVFGLAGDFDAAAPDDLRDLLADIEGEHAFVTFPAPEAPDRLTLVLVDKPDRTQAQVRMTHAGLDQRSDAFPAFLLANDAFGGVFSARLNQEVRVKRGWSYYAYSFPTVNARQTAFDVVLAPGAENTADAIALVLDLVEAAKADGLAEAEVEQSRSARLNGAPFLVDTAAERLGHAMAKERTGYDRLGALEPMKTLTAEQANAAFTDVVAPDRLVIAVVCTAADLQARLATEYGQVKVISYTEL